MRRWRAGGVASVLLGLAVAASAEAGTAADWPQYRGPNRDGKSTETGLVRSWGSDGPREVWRIPIGAGFSGVSVVGDRLYTMDSDQETEYALCLDAATGKTLWRVSVGPIFKEGNGDGPRAAPTVDGDLVFVLGSRGHLAALKKDSGEVVWKVDYAEAFGSELPIWAFTSAPLVEGELLIMETGGSEKRAVAAFDKRSGEVRWTAQGATIAYSSPIALDLGGRRQLVFLLKEKLVALDRNGKEIWSFAWAPDGGIKPALPVFLPPDRVLVGASYDIGAVLVKVDGSGSSAEEVWSSRFMRTHINTAVALGDHIYGFDTGTLRCLDAGTGERGWAERGLTLASGAVQKWYLDQETFLVVRKEVVSEKTEGENRFAAYERPRSWHYDDYRPMAGVMVPFWVYVEEPLFNREYIFETIEANVALEDELFAPPPGSYQSKP